MKELKFLIVIMLYIFSISLTTFSQANTAVSMNMANLADEDLILQFSSKEVKEKTKIAVEIFKRGEKMIPALMKLKGNELKYDGFCLGDPEGADSVYSISGIKGSEVSIQVASLYLINAIYFNNLHFANLPYLSDKKQDKVKGFKHYDYNSSKRVNKAWDSTEKWFEKYQKEGLDNLRKSNEFPLKFSNIYFVGTNPNRKRDFPGCK